MNHETFLCGDCGNLNRPGTAKCWLCGSEKIMRIGALPPRSTGTEIATAKKEVIWHLNDELPSSPRRPVAMHNGIVVAAGLVLAVLFWLALDQGLAIIIDMAIGVSILAILGRARDSASPQSRSTTGSIFSVVASVLATVAIVVSVVAITAAIAVISMVVAVLSICTGIFHK